MTVVAMGGLAGGGARSLGPILAQRLEADYIDRLILTDIARQVGATVEALNQREERPPTKGERLSRLVQRILERSAVAGAGGDPYFGPGVAAFLTEEYEDIPHQTITKGHELEDEIYFDGVRKVIRDLAGSGNVVMVGRGSCIVLKGLPNVLRVGIEASLETRIATIMQREKLNRQDASRTIQARDDARRYYFKRFFGIDDPEDAEHYHLVLNMSEISLDYASDIVIDAAKALEDGRLANKAIMVS